MEQWIKEVAKGQRGSKDLSYDEASLAASVICDGKATDAQLAAFLIGERIKMETPDELFAFIEQFSKRTEKLNLPNEIKEKLIDFASPYTGRNSFIATIPISILLADRGIPAFLHCSDALPPKYGITIKDVLAKLGIPVDQTANEVSRTIQQVNLGFADTEKFNPALANIRKVRKEIHVRTLFNTAEKLMNISDAKSIMLAAFHRSAINKIAPIFEKLAFKNVYIVQGIEGSEDLPVHRNSFVYKISNGQMESQIISPKKYNLAIDENLFSKKISLDDQCRYVNDILEGKENEELTYVRNQVIFNTAVRYYLFGYESSIESGIEYVKEQLAFKKGIEKLNQWIHN